MLVLSRRRNESIMIHIGDTVVTVKVCLIEDGRVRLGIVAPKEIRVDREEVYQEFLKHKEGR